MQNQKTDSSACLDILELALAPLDLPCDLDDAEDYKLTDKESKSFGQALNNTEAIAASSPQNTVNTTCWAHNVWKSWCKFHGIIQPLHEIQDDKMNELLS